MNIFDIIGARHYCRGFGAAPGASLGSAKDYCRNVLRGVHGVQEGTAAFDQYRDCALRDVDRCLLLAATHYRRALDLLTIASSPWAHVTLYYGSFFAARAIMGMFGSWIDAPKLRIEPKVNAPGHQELSISRNVQGFTTYRGSHQMFWDFYYVGAATLVPWVAPRHLLAITAVSSNPTWQIESRNQVNYDSHYACQLSRAFSATFRASRFPSCLPGTLSTQYQVTKATVDLAFTFARRFRLRTDALAVLGVGARRGDVIRKLVFEARPPRLRHGLLGKRILA